MVFFVIFHAANMYRLLTSKHRKQKLTHKNLHIWCNAALKCIRLACIGNVICYWIWKSKKCIQIVYFLVFAMFKFMYGMTLHYVRHLNDNEFTYIYIHVLFELLVALTDLEFSGNGAKIVQIVNSNNHIFQFGIFIERSAIIQVSNTVIDTQYSSWFENN